MLGVVFYMLLGATLLQLYQIMVVKKEPENQVVNINSISALASTKFFLLREKHRHEADIKKIEIDLAKLADIEVPQEVLARLDYWHEVGGLKCQEKEC